MRLVYGLTVYEYLHIRFECFDRDGKIVGCSEWSASGVKRHICELQILVESDREDLARKCTDYGELRNMAGR